MRFPAWHQYVLSAHFQLKLFKMFIFKWTNWNSKMFIFKCQLQPFKAQVRKPWKTLWVWFCLSSCQWLLALWSPSSFNAALLRLELPIDPMTSQPRPAAGQLMKPNANNKPGNGRASSRLANLTERMTWCLFKIGSIFLQQANVSIETRVAVEWQSHKKFKYAANASTLADLRNGMPKKLSGAAKLKVMLCIWFMHKCIYIYIYFKKWSLYIDMRHVYTTH